MKYKAFISYSHADGKIAERLHARLERYKPPEGIRAASQVEATLRPLKPIFLDRAELGAAGELSVEVLQALDESQALIVVCSPNSVASEWVGREIKYFRSHYPHRSVFAFVVGGNPSADPRIINNRAAFPLELLLSEPDNVASAFSEPLAADARPQGDGFKSAFLKLAAGLLGVKYDQLYRRDQRRQRQRLTLISFISAGLAIAFAVIALQAVTARKQADLARDQAQIQLKTEQQTREFLLSVFKLAEPSESRGNTVTVREILDRSVNQISNAEFSSTTIKAKLLSTMGQAYANLGLYTKSIELLKASSELLSLDSHNEAARLQQVENLIHLSDVHFAMGDYEQAQNQVDQAAELQPEDSEGSINQVRLRNIAGDIASYQENDDLAKTSYQGALRLLQSIDAPSQQFALEKSRSLGGLAVLAHFQGDSVMAEKLYGEALEVLASRFGSDHPDSIWAAFSLGSAAYLNGNTELAGDTWEELLDVASKVLGSDHPEIATVRNNLGLLALEEGKFAHARKLLEMSVSNDRANRTEEFDDLVYPLSNLAVINIFEGKLSHAHELLGEAHEIAKKSQHRWLGPVINYQADLSCLMSQPRKGIALSAMALKRIESEFGPDDWRLHQAKLTRWYCESALQAVSDSHLVQESFAKVVERWGTNVVYSQRAIEQLVAIYRNLGAAEKSIEMKKQSLGWMKASDSRKDGKALRVMDE